MIETKRADIVILNFSAIKIHLLFLGALRLLVMPGQDEGSTSLRRVQVAAAQKKGTLTPKKVLRATVTA